MLNREQEEYIKQLAKEGSSEYYKMFLKKKRNQRYKDNREKIKKQSKLYRDNNKEFYKQYRNEHKEENKIWQNNKWKRDLKFKINKAISCQIRFSLKGSKNGQHWETIVGYSYRSLIRHLKKTMPEDYTWQDYINGKLHIDHIIPKSVFNFNKPEHIDFKRCWALDNLRLLPKKENMYKRNKLFEPFQPSLKI